MRLEHQFSTLPDRPDDLLDGELAVTANPKYAELRLSIVLPAEAFVLDADGNHITDGINISDEINIEAEGHVATASIVEYFIAMGRQLEREWSPNWRQRCTEKMTRS